MKKVTVGMITVLMLSPLISTQAKAVTENNPTEVATTPVESAEVTALINRVNEIKAMDKSAMTSTEKKELRKELRTIKANLNDGGHGGVYLSVGAIILVIVLLIILL